MIPTLLFFLLLLFVSKKKKGERGQETDRERVYLNWIKEREL